MKNSNALILAALAASSGTVMAQSSVQVFGLVDLAAIYGHGSKTHLWQMGAANMSSRIGFRGTEDLGNGLSAGFWLEGGFNADDGTGIASNTNNQTSGATTGFGWNRRATVSLVSKKYGEIRLGRDYSAQYRNRVETDPWNSIGVATIQPFQASQGGPVSTRASNLATYFLPEEGLGGLYGMVQAYRGETQDGAGNGEATRMGYKWNGLNVSLSAAHTRYNPTATAGSINSLSAAVQYPVGPVLLKAGYFKDTIYATVGRLPYTGWTFSGVYSVGAAVLKAGVSEYGQSYGAKQNGLKLSLGGEYYLSKRTLLYVDVAQLRNRNGMAMGIAGATTDPNTHPWASDMGIRHNF